MLAHPITFMLSFARRGLRVIMYHKVAESADALTVTPAQLDQQLGWLAAKGATFVRLADVVRSTREPDVLPAWPVVITFDDAYVDTFELARPVLQRRQVRAVVFVPTAFVGRTSAWDADARPIMSEAQLRTLAHDGWELALHSHNHVNYRHVSPAAISSDVGRCVAFFRRHDLPWQPALAYPYGGRPAARAAREAMRTTLAAHGIACAFRIGDRINPLPLRDRFEINRLGVRGDASFGAFQRKFRWGRLL